MQLEDYHRFEVVKFVEYDPAKLARFDLNDVESVRDFQESLLTNMNLYAEWRARNYGLSDYIGMGSQFVWPFTQNDQFDS